VISVDCPKVNEKKRPRLEDCVVNVKMPIPVHRPVKFPVIPGSDIPDDQKVSYLGVDIEEFKKKGRVAPRSAGR
jgi:hypothetical protein